MCSGSGVRGRHEVCTGCYTITGDAGMLSVLRIWRRTRCSTSGEDSAGGQRGHGGMFADRLAYNASLWCSLLPFLSDSG
jgi:hypothetical protein